MQLFPDILIILRSAFDAFLVICGVSIIGFGLLPSAWRPARPALTILVSTSFGMTITSLVVWIIGGTLGTKFIIPAVLLLLIYALFTISKWYRNLKLAFHGGWKLIRSSPIATAILMLPVIWCIPSLILPVIDTDGLRYHLALPKLFLLEGHIFRYPWDITGAYPQSSEMLYLVELIIGPGEAAKFLHFFVFLLSISTIILMIRKNNNNRHGAFLGALLFAVSPVVLATAGTAFIDNFIIFHLGVACLLIRFKARPILIGLVLAGAAWTKWTVAPGVLGCFVVIWFSAQAGKKWRSTLFAVVPVVLVLTPLALRNLISIGDPFYPVMTGLIRGNVAEVDTTSFQYVTQRHKSLPGPLKIPWGLSVGKVEVDEVVGWHHLLGLVLLPLALRDRRTRVAAGLIIPYLIFEIWLHPSIRLSMPFIWGLAVVEGQILSKLRPRWAFFPALLVAIPILIFMGAALFKTPLMYIRGDLTRQEVEQRIIPAWDAANFVNKWPGQGRVMAMDFPAPYLFNRPWVAEGLVNKPPLQLWLDQTKTVDGLLEKIHSHGIKLLVVTPGYGGGQTFALLPVSRSKHEANLILMLKKHLKKVYSKDSVDVYSLLD